MNDDKRDYIDEYVGYVLPYLTGLGIILLVGAVVRAMAVTL